jgi:plastocyanin
MFLRVASWWLRVFGALAGVVWVAGVACGGGDGASSVEVRFSEWEVAVAPSEAAAGRVTLAVENAGSLAHNLVVVKSDLPAGELPVVDGRVEVSRLNVVGGGGPVAPGTTADAAFEGELSAGKYVLFCDVVSGGESHYANGMSGGLLVEP